MPWLIIKFNDTNEVEIVPSTWFNRNSKKCLYPSFPKSKLEKAIKQQLAPPDSPDEEWKEYPGELMSQKEYENFNIANGKASKACLTSDLSDVDDIPRKRIPKKKIYDDDEVYSYSSEENDELLTLSNFKKHPFTKKKGHGGTADSTHINRDISDDHCITSSCSSSKCSKETEGATFEKEVLRYLIYNKKHLESLEKQIANLCTQMSQNVVEPKSDDLLSNLPIETLEQFKNFQQQLTDDETTQALEHLKYLTQKLRTRKLNYKLVFG